MGLYVYWDEKNQHTIRVDIVGTWVWEDYHTYLALFSETMTTTLACACIVDMRHTQVMPVQNALNHLRQMLDETPALAIILVSSNAQLNNMVTVIKRAIPDAEMMMFVSKTLDEAYQIIDERLKD